VAAGQGQAAEDAQAGEGRQQAYPVHADVLPGAPG
jgi:hypothetical protein